MIAGAARRPQHAGDQGEIDALKIVDGVPHHPDFVAVVALENRLRAGQLLELAAHELGHRRAVVQVDVGAVELTRPIGLDQLVQALDDLRQLGLDDEVDGAAVRPAVLQHILPVGGLQAVAQKFVQRLDQQDVARVGALDQLGHMQAEADADDDEEAGAVDRRRRC